ncbi:MAG: pilus assembly protein N-terminal domain-containing protein [Oligoflexia bacterium]|nr:pilus assembly protein N-terminal domain-containing protein [Oligoflexia bacterium]
MNNESYFSALLSSCIENLGVEPLFLSSFFLFAPDLLTLFARFVFVTLVRDTIKKLLYIIFIVLDCYLLYLPGLALVVKTILLFFICIGPDCNATPIENKIQNNYSTIILSIGEQQEIIIKGLDKFSIGNGDIIKAKYLPKSNMLIIKGKKIGFTNISIITNKPIISNKPIQQIPVFVLPKRDELKMMEIVSLLKLLKSPLTIKEAAATLVVEGTIDNFNDYYFIQSLEKKINKNSIILNLKLKTNLRNQIIGEIYYFLLQEYIRDINCYSRNINIYCTYDQSTIPSEKLMKNLQEEFYVTFIPLATKPQFQNYLLKMQLVQMEKMDGEEFSLGLNRLSGTLSDFFHSGIENIILKNEVLLEKQKVKLRTLAEPKIIVKTNHKVALQMGSDVPYEIKRNSHGNTSTHTIEWHFVGLKINLELKERYDDYEIEYTTEFSQSSSNQKIDGSKQSSKLQIKLGDAIQLFEIGITSNGSKESAMPWASSIPLIGGLFTSTSEQKIFKKIYGLAIIQSSDSNSVSNSVSNSDSASAITLTSQETPTPQ